MNVKSYWVPVEDFNGTPVVKMTVWAPVQVSPVRAELRPLGVVGAIEDGRALVLLKTPMPFEALEALGVGFSQFEDTE